MHFVRGGCKDSQSTPTVGANSFHIAASSKQRHCAEEESRESNNPERTHLLGCISSEEVRSDEFMRLTPRPLCGASLAGTTPSGVTLYLVPLLLVPPLLLARRLDRWYQADHWNRRHQNRYLTLHRLPGTCEAPQSRTLPSCLVTR